MQFRDEWTKQRPDGRTVQFTVTRPSESTRVATITAKVIEGTPGHSEVRTVNNAPETITREWVESQFEF